MYAFDNEVLGEQGTLGRKSQSEVVLTRHLRMALKRLNPWMTGKQLEEAIERMTCPIGVPGITGKEPEVIAIAVVAQLLQASSSGN